MPNRATANVLERKAERADPDRSPLSAARKGRNR